MTRFLIYLFPALIDMALGCVMLVAPVRMAAVEGSTALAVTMLPMAWAACYSVVCWIIRLIVNKRNAAWLTVAGSAGIALTAVLFIVYPQPMVMYTLMVPQAISTALFFVPFQVFMKSVEGDHDEGVVRSTALYTASWSVGLGAGPFVAGWMMTRWGWQSCMLLNIAIGLATAAGILLLKHHAYAAHDDRRATPSDTRERGENDYGRMPDLAWLGWVGSGVGFVVMAIYSSLLPKEAEMFGIPAFRLGIILATASWVRAFLDDSVRRGSTPGSVFRGGGVFRHLLRSVLLLLRVPFPCAPEAQRQIRFDQRSGRRGMHDGRPVSWRPAGRLVQLCHTVSGRRGCRPRGCCSASHCAQEARPRLDPDRYRRYARHRTTVGPVTGPGAVRLCRFPGSTGYTACAERAAFSAEEAS